MRTLLRTLANGAQILRTSPGVAAAAIAALAMGIGFTTAMFGIVRGGTRPLPVERPEEIVAIQKTSSRGVVRDQSSYGFDLSLWRAARSFDGMAAFQATASNLAGDGREAERVSGAIVTSDAFAVLGFVPATGRSFSAADARPGAASVVMLSDRLWRQRYGGDPQFVGRTIRIDGRPHTVIGIMAPGMGFPVNAALWTAMTDAPMAAPGEGPTLTVFGRLGDGVSIETARAELEETVRTAAASHPDSHGGVGIQVLPFTEIETPREVIRGLQLLVIAVSFVLLIACGNVASLLVVRGVSRARETATRIALGASRRQLVVDQIAEALTLSAIATCLGLAIAHVALRVFASSTSAIIEAFWVDFRVDGRVALFAATLAAITTAAAGLGPALRISSTDAIEVLKDRSHGSSGVRLGWLSRRLPGAQIALACGLLAMTVAIGRAAVELRTRAWPFDPTRVLTAQYGLTSDDLADQARRNRLLSTLVTAVAAQPGVEAAALVSALPGRGSGDWGISFDQPVERGRPAPHTTGITFVTPEFFDVLGARVLTGRGLTWQDDAGRAPVAVVNASFVRRFFPDRDPVGRQVFLGSRALTIVGVVPDLMARDIQESRQDGLYAPMLQSRPFAVRVVVRGRGDLAALLRRETAKVNPGLPLFEMSTLREAALADKAVLDVLSELFLFFGAGALGLTALGLYGVVSFAVAQRTREFGIRLALGATPADIARIVAKQGLRQILVGVSVGLVLAIVLTRAFAAAVEGIPAGDAEALVVIAVSIILTAALAMAAPARRAVSIEIVKALRQE